MTTEDRIIKVEAAIDQLPELLAYAVHQHERGQDAREAWEKVEQAAAVAHRQARLLAGKPRGG